MKATATNYRAVAALAAAGLALGGCRGTAGRPDGARLFVFVDLSGSVKPEQRSRWEAEARKLVRGLGAGWHVTVYPVHAQTMGAAPLFSAEIPPIARDAGMDRRKRFNKALKAARTGAETALRAALDSAGGAPATDLFSALDRIKPDATGRPTIAVFFSDMINSTEELDMGRGRPADLEAAVLERLASRHFWHRETLRGVRVYCILNAFETANSGPDRRLLKRFYQSLFESLGARLAHFDTHLDSWNPESTQGEEHAGD